MQTNEFPKEIYVEIIGDSDEDNPFYLNTWETLEGGAVIEPKRIGVYQLVSIQDVRLVVSREIVSEKVG